MQEANIFAEKFLLIHIKKSLHSTIAKGRRDVTKKQRPTQPDAVSARACALTSHEAIFDCRIRITAAVSRPAGQLLTLYVL